MIGRCRSALLVVLLTGVVAAQPQLVVNGLDVAGVSADLVPGTTYAPAGALAQALGARLDVDLTSQRVTFALGGRIVQVRSVDDPAGAMTLGDALRVDGIARDGPAAVRRGVESYVPVKVVAEALGARVSFVPERNQVIVVAPRARISASLEGSDRSERLVLRASTPTRVTSFFNETVQTLHLRFERSDVASAQSFVGSGFVRADVVPAGGDVDVRIQLAPEVRVDWTELPDGGGFAVVVSFASAGPGAPETPAAVEAARVVLDPAVGTGMAADEAAELTLDVARVAAQRLERAGFDVVLTRSGPALPAVAERSALGTGARVFVSIQVADLPPGSLRLYHLGEATDLRALEDAVRFNAEALVDRPETDAVRRQVLLELIVDLELGARYAESMAASLRDAGGYQVSPPRAAPVAVLTGAAGRGLVLEVGPADLRDPGFAQLLAATLATVATSGGMLP